jgi:hypothetical protein
LLARLTKIIAAYQLLLDAHGMPQRYQFLRVRLQMEQHKLLDWASIANLSEKDTTLSTGLRLSRHTINDVLHQIESLLHDLSGLSSKYKLKLVVDDNVSTCDQSEEGSAQVSNRIHIMSETDMEP